MRIVTGPDNALWVTEYDGGKVGHVTPDGTITELPMTFSQPDGITVRRGQVWITEESGNRVDEISLTATLLALTMPQARSGPEQVALGPSDTLWVSEYTGHRIARVTIPAS